MTTQQQQRFQAASEKIIGKKRQRQGIGTLSEKTVHAVLKEYLEPDVTCHEIPIEGCVADIFTGKEILEIQTRSFDKLRTKLERFLPICPVTVVFPIPHEKKLIWIDEETGELSKARKSPLTGSAYLAFPELYKIKTYLKSPNFHLKLILLDLEEYRLLNGWSRDKKKGSSRFDRIPSNIWDEMDFQEPRDFIQLIPYELQEPFTTADFAKAAKIRKPLSQTVLHILHYLELVERVGKKGNSYLYEVIEVGKEK